MMIRFRLILWNVTVLCASTLALGIATYAFTKYNLERALDNGLAKRVGKLVNEMVSHPGLPPPFDNHGHGGDHQGDRRPDGLDPSDPGQGNEDQQRGPRRPPGSGQVLLLPRLFDGDGRSMGWETPYNGEVNRLRHTNGESWTSVLSPDAPGVPLRVYTRSFTNRDGEWHVIQMADSTEPTRQEVDRLRRLLTTLVPASWIFMVAAGFLLTDRALKPVGKLAASADELLDGPMTGRLPINGSDEMARLAGTFNKVLDRQQHAYRQMERFTSDAAHELRSPLMAILTRATAPRGADISREKLIERLESIGRSTGHMSQTVDDLLLLARLDENGISSMNLRFSMRELVDDLFTESEEVFGGRLEIGQLDEAEVVGRPELIRRAVMNLLDNVRKYAPEGKVRVSLVSSAGFARVTVADEGPGVASEHLSKLTDRFYRIDEGRTHDAGDQSTGLGLAIVASVVEIHHGSVELSSPEGHGLSVTLKFPLARPETSPE